MIFKFYPWEARVQLPGSKINKIQDNCIRIFIFSISDYVYDEEGNQDTEVIDVCETCQADVEELNNSEDKIQGMFPRHPWNWLIDKKKWMLAS